MSFLEIQLLELQPYARFLRSSFPMGLCKGFHPEVTGRDKGKKNKIHISPAANMVAYLTSEKKGKCNLIPVSSWCWWWFQYLSFYLFNLKKDISNQSKALAEISFHVIFQFIPSSNLFSFIWWAQLVATLSLHVPFSPSPQSSGNLFGRDSLRKIRENVYKVLWGWICQSHPILRMCEAGHSKVHIRNGHFVSLLN